MSRKQKKAAKNAFMYVMPYIPEFQKKGWKIKADYEKGSIIISNEMILKRA